MPTYTPTIGLEVHAELNTHSKMFCGCKNDPHHETPNYYVCPVCMGHPGTLPVVNAEAVKKVLLFGLAVDGTVADFTEFDRKNYFYPDIPKAYQISQYAFPLVSGGSVCEVALTRVHLEEDTARNQHEVGVGSLVNFNRAGVPLMELVTEPVIHDAATAGAFARELQLILRTIGVSHAHMERGEMRVEANISISPDDTFGTKVEVKNLNSFRSVEAAIAYEIDRQVNLHEAGEVVVQETRGWDEERQRTFGQRSKETAMDYRYFPDPDIPKFSISQCVDLATEKLLSEIPELPKIKRQKYSYFGIPSQQIEIIIQNEYVDVMLTKLSEGGVASPEVVRMAANYLTSDAVKLFSDKGAPPNTYHVRSVQQLCDLLVSDKLTSRAGKDILAEVLYDGIDPGQVAKARGLLQMNDTAALTELVQKVIREHPDVVADYKNGKESSIQFLVGQGMKQSKGSANPKMLLELLKNELSESRT